MNGSYFITKDGNQQLVGDVMYHDNNRKRFNVKEIHVADGATTFKAANLPYKVKVFLPDSVEYIYTITSEVEFDTMPANLKTAYVCAQSTIPNIRKFMHSDAKIQIHNKARTIADNIAIAGRATCVSCGAVEESEIHICIER